MITGNKVNHGVKITCFIIMFILAIAVFIIAIKSAENMAIVDSKISTPSVTLNYIIIILAKCSGLTLQ